MSGAEKDTARATAAAREIFDGRSPTDDWSSVLVTTEHAIATVLHGVSLVTVNKLQMPVSGRPVYTCPVRGILNRVPFF